MQNVEQEGQVVPDCLSIQIAGLSLQSGVRHLFDIVG
jgi:hypothetical protein